MQERADAMGGQLIVESGRGRGTAVRVTIALEDFA
jgi:signal transduction histidine kinase